jgi:DNA-binding MarR family transcriptional regulator
MIFTEPRDPGFITVRRGGALSDAHHHLLALWAAACAEHVLHLFEEALPGDDRPRHAIEQNHAWVRGKITMGQAHKAAFAANAAAKEVSDAAKYAAYAAGQAVAVAHVPAKRARRCSLCDQSHTTPKCLTPGCLMCTFGSMSNQSPRESRKFLSSEFLRWLRIVEDHSQKLIEEHLKPFGLSLSQGFLFGLIADSALKGIAPLQKDLERDMRLVTSSITNLVQGLERKGLIFRMDSAADGRAKELHVTKNGWKVREELGRHVTDWQGALARSLTDKELAVAVQLLRKMGRSYE